MGLNRDQSTAECALLHLLQGAFSRRHVQTQNSKKDFVLLYELADSLLSTNRYLIKALAGQTSPIFSSNIIGLLHTIFEMLVKSMKFA